MRRYFNTAATFALGDEEQFIQDVEVVSGTTITTPSGSVSPSGPGWEYAIHGGLRFTFSPEHGQILAGHSPLYPKTEPQVVDTFLEFASQYWEPESLQYQVFTNPWPRIHGWKQEDIGATKTFDTQDFAWEPSRTYWPGATFSASATLEWQQPSHAVEGPRDRLLRTLHTLFEVARDETFNYGEPSQFAEGIRNLLAGSGSRGLEALTIYLFDSKALAVEPAMESVAVVGRMDVAGQRERIDFLRRLLTHDLLPLRDAATLALVDLGDPEGASLLRAAADKQSHPQLRENMLDAARQLAR